MRLYENIKRRRKELGMTQTDLAIRVGYADKTAIAHIEKGDIDLPQSKIVAFAKALQTTPGDLMGEVEPAETTEDFRQRMTENKVIFDLLEKATPEDRKKIETIIKTIVSDE